MEGRVATTVTLLATAHLAGELALLPRLFTLITQERRAAAGPVILLDLGDTCSAESWVCRATLGRAPFLVLDSMGYDAALIGGPEQVPIPLPSLKKLVDGLGLSLIVWNRAFRLTKQGITITIAPGAASLPADEPAVRIDRSIEVLPDVGAPPHAGAPPTLGDVAQGTLARVDLHWPAWTVEAARWIPLAPATLPDPTIAAVVDLVETEARRTMQHQGGNP